jgi:hypothetical protein
LFLWSTNGADYARKAANLYKLGELFEGFASKPDIIIDDTLNPVVFDVSRETSWLALAEQILRKHVD